MKGRPRLDPKIKMLITQMSRANPLWGAPRIHGELLKLGIEVSQTVVAKYLVRDGKPPSQTWRTFLENHAKDIVATDFFTVSTATFRVLFVLVVLSHDRRENPHTNVTESPTAEWTARQIIEAVGLDEGWVILSRLRFSRHANRPLHPLVGAERVGKPRTRFRSGLIRQRLRVPRLIDFVNFGESAIGGPSGLAGVPFRRYPVAGDS